MIAKLVALAGAIVLFIWAIKWAWVVCPLV